MIEIDTVLMRVKTGHQGDERRPAHARFEIAVLQYGRPRSQLIQVGSVDPLIPHEAEVEPRLIIRNDVDDVRMFCRFECHPCGKDYQAKQPPHFFGMQFKV